MFGVLLKMRACYWNLGDALSARACCETLKPLRMVRNAVMLFRTWDDFGAFESLIQLAHAVPRRVRWF